MKKIVTLGVAFAVLVVSAMPTYANDPSKPGIAIQKNHTVKGEVVSVDKAAGKVMLKHEAVPELRWSAMTMYFAVADKSQINGLKSGDRVEIQFVVASGSSPLITRIKSEK